MCEILLRVHDKINADPYLDVLCLKRGDAVVVCPDGWAWTPLELTNPDWRIVALPNVTERQAEGFLAPEVNTDPANPSRVLRRRAFRLKLADITIPLAIRQWFADDTRAQGIRTINMTPAQFLALKEPKEPAIDPNVLT